MIAALRRLFGRDTSTCRCGHDAEAHEHWRQGSDCGACGAGVCPRFRARRWRGTLVDLDEVHRYDMAIDAVLADRIDRALDLVPADVVGMLAALADTGRRAT